MKNAGAPSSHRRATLLSPVPSSLLLESRFAWPPDSALRGTCQRSTADRSAQGVLRTWLSKTASSFDGTPMEIETRKTVTLSPSRMRIGHHAVSQFPLRGRDPGHSANVLGTKKKGFKHLFLIVQRYAGAGVRNDAVNPVFKLPDVQSQRVRWRQCIKGVDD